MRHRMELLMQGNKTLITAENISARMGKKPLFSGLSFTVKEGEFVLVQAGSHQTAQALLLVLGGLHPFEGGVAVCGTELQGASDKASSELRRLHLSYLMGDNLCVPDRTVLWNLKQIAATPQEKLPDILKTVGLEEKQGLKAKKLTRPEQERLAVGMVLAKKPALLLCDGAALTDQALAEFVKTMNRDGTAVLLCENDSRFEETADQILTI